MSVERKFAVCGICGNFVGVIDEGGGELVCCGEPMKLLNANTTDAAKEKHVPVAVKEGKNLHVSIGEAPHPMTPEHQIKWIATAQGNKTQRVKLAPSDEPKAEFSVNDDGSTITVYEYCNLHGLWKLDM